MKESVVLSNIFNVEPNVLYDSWLNSSKHSKMTGGNAICSKEVGASHSAWDGYIWCTNVELIENTTIKQTWRTAEFDEMDEDSTLIIEFKKTSKGTELCLEHRNIPAGQTQYHQGWIDNYFVPMTRYFAG